MKVLVVDDDRALREVLSRTVALWGYESSVAADGVEAVNALQGPDPAQIVLMDLMMPNMNGIEACRRIRLTVPGFVYIVVLTAIDTKENLIQAMEAGAHDFLPKPVDMTELRFRLAVGKRLAEAEAEARKHHFFLEAAAEGSGLGMWEVDVPRQAIRINRRLREMLGLKEEEITIREWLDLVHEEDFAQVKDQLQQNSSIGSDSEYRIRNALGKWRWVQVLGKVIRTAADGAPLQICGCIQDITCRVEKENRMFEAERLAAVHTLAAGVAHHFNNLNTGISGNLELLLRDSSLVPQTRQWGERALAASQRITAITDSLLRLSSQREPSGNSRHPLRQIIDDILLFLENDFEKEAISVEVELEEGLSVNGDAGALAQVVFILLDNARHALCNTPRRALRIAGKSDGGRVILTVADNGCGIPHEDLRKIFSPFFSTKGEHAPRGSYMGNFRGMGIGLFTAKNIIEWHHGEIRVESCAGEGTTITLSLPQPDQPSFAG